MATNNGVQARCWEGGASQCALFSVIWGKCTDDRRALPSADYTFSGKSFSPSFIFKVNISLLSYLNNNTQQCI